MSSNLEEILNKAENALIEGEFEEAFKIYKNVLQELEIPKSHIFRKAVRSAFLSNHKDEALEICATGLGIYPKDVNLLSQGSVQNFLSANYELSTDLCKRLLSVNPDNLNGLFWMGKNLRIQNKPDAAVKYFEAGVAQSNEARFIIELGQMAIQNGDYTLAKSYYDQHPNTEKNPWIWVNKANIQFEMGDHETFNDTLNEGLELSNDIEPILTRKIYLLNRLLRFRESRHTIEQYRTKIEDFVTFKLLGFTFMSEFNWPEAITNFSKSLESKKSLNVTLDLAQCLINSNRLPEADTLLKTLLSEPAISENVRFWDLYSNVLSSNSPQTWSETMSKLGNVRMSLLRFLTFVQNFEEKKLFDLGIQFCDETKNRNDQSLQVKLQARFEALRLQNLQSLSLGEAETVRLKENIVHVEKEVIKLLQGNSSSQNWINSNLNYLQNFQAKTLLTSRNNPLISLEIAQLIIQAIKKKEPFSLIRLGDGEGIFLPYPEEFKEYKRSDSVEMQQVFFGEIQITNKDLAELSQKLLESVQSADIVGVPEIQRLARVINVNTVFPYQRLTRGIINVNRITQKYSRDNQSIVSAYIHQDLEIWGLYDLIFDVMDSCSLITTHRKLADSLKARFNLTVDETILLPPEYKWHFMFDENELGSHFPVVFDQVCKKLSTPHNGKVFLVAGGFLAKIYCHIIKQNGGIAVDIGSMADNWLGYQTRNYPMINGLGKVLAFGSYLTEVPDYYFPSTEPSQNSNRFVIAAAGNGVRWKNYLGKKKHLIEIGGESLVERTIRLVHKFNPGAEIIVIGKDNAYSFDGSVTAIPSYYCGAKFLNKPAIYASKNLWNPDGFTTLLFGDTFYTEDCLKKISADNIYSSPRFFGRPKGSQLTGKVYGEIFAIRFSHQIIEDLNERLQSLNELHEKNLLPRFQGWDLHRHAENIPLGSGHLGPNFIAITDFTDDFDFPIDYDKWVKAVEEKVGPIQGKKVRDL